jgi:hypothetical protein
MLPAKDCRNRSGPWLLLPLRLSSRGAAYSRQKSLKRVGGSSVERDS